MPNYPGRNSKLEQKYTKYRFVAGTTWSPTFSSHSTLRSLTIPSKQPKNAKIDQNRLFLGDFGFQNSQTGQIIDWTCVNKWYGHWIRHLVGAGRIKSSLNIKKLWKTAFLGIKSCAKSPRSKISPNDRDYLFQESIWDLHAKFQI